MQDFGKLLKKILLKLFFNGFFKFVKDTSGLIRVYNQNYKITSFDPN